MMNFIVSGDIESFEAATNLLLKEFDQYLSKNSRAQYLTGDPSDIGGLCAGRHGEVASTQGAERRGGWIKENLNEEYVMLDLDEEIEDWEGAIEWALGGKGVDGGKEGSADYFAFSCEDIARLNSMLRI